MRYIAITDIHGELKKLESVLSQIDTRPDDVFVFMGDYIDRGPDSRGVVDRIIALGETNKCIYLIGLLQESQILLLNRQVSFCSRRYKSGLSAGRAG